MKNKYSLFSLIKNSFSYHENWQRAWRDPEPKPSYDTVIIGGGGGRIKGGQNLDYLEKKDRQMSRLFLSMMDKMDVRPGSFGDADKPLNEV